MHFDAAYVLVDHDRSNPAATHNTWIVSSLHSNFTIDDHMIIAPLEYIAVHVNHHAHLYSSF